jgi:iron complex transport system substrate-binding protein
LIRARRSFTPVLGLTLLLAVCPPRAGSPVVAADDGGQQVRLTRPANRIVSLNPTVTELLFAIGAGGQIIGRTRWCDWPPAALAIPSVGDGFPPNVEAVVARHPDLAVAYSTALNEPALAQLRNLGVPVLALRTDRLEDFARAARILGRVTGRNRSGDSLAARIETAITERRHVREPGPRAPTVVILTWDTPPIAIGHESYLHQVVELAGGRNLFGDVGRSSFPVSLEAIAERNPDLLLVIGGLRATILQRPEWRAVRAVRDGGVLVLDDPALARPSFRALDGVAPLRARLSHFVSSSSSSSEIVR